MVITETTFKEDISNLILHLKKSLPKKKEVVIFDTDKSAVQHLSSIHAEAKNVFPKCFQGAKLMIHNELLDKVKLVQNYDLGNTDKTHKAVLQILQKETAPKHVDDGLLLDTSRSAIATYTKKIKDGQLRITSKIKHLTSSETEVLVERRKEKYMSSIAFSMKNGNPTTLGVLTQYMYRIRPDFYLGGEFGFKPFCARSIPRFSISCRYDLPYFVISATSTQTGLQFCAFKDLSKDLRVATVVTHTMRETVLSLAVHKSGIDSDFKVFIDSMCCTGFTYEKNLVFDESIATRLIRMKVSALIDRQGKLRCGMGFVLDF